MVKEVNGIQFKLDLSENIDSSLFYYGYYEKETTELLERLVKGGMVILDIGANVGVHSLAMAQQLKRTGGIVHAFEPTTWAFEKLKYNNQLNNFPNLHLHRIALSDVNGEQKILCTASEEVMPFKASWDISGKSKNRGQDHLIFQKLDDWVVEKGVTQIDLIKIDVDGYEVKVLNGALESFKKFRPLLIIELGYATLKRVGNSPVELLDLLEQFHYDLFSTSLPEIKYDRNYLLKILPTVKAIDIFCRPRLLQ